MPAASRIHPWFFELALSARNRARGALVAWRQALLHAAAWAALLGALAFVWSFLDGDEPGLILQALAKQPSVAIVLLAGIAFALTYAVLKPLQHELRYGWWGAMPIAVATRRGAIRWLTLALALGQSLVAAGLLGAIALVAHYWRRWFGPMLALSALAIPLGALVGMLASNRSAARAGAGAARIVTHGKPVLPLHLLERGRLAAIASWQRLETLASWRSGAAAWAFALIAALVPAGAAWSSLSGMMLFTVTLIWLAVALKKSADVIAAYAELTAATPISFRAFAWSSARFPALATIAAALSGGLGLWFQGAPGVFLPGLALVLAALAALHLALALRYRRQPLRARLRFALELALLAALAQLLLPLALVAYSFLLLRHLARARSLR